LDYPYKKHRDDVILTAKLALTIINGNKYDCRFKIMNNYDIDSPREENLSMEWSYKQVLILVFGLLGLAEVVATLGAIIVESIPSISQDFISSPYFNLILTAFRNTIGVIAILYLMRRGLVPDLKESEDTDFSEVDKPAKWTVKWFLMIGAAIYATLILIQLAIAASGTNIDTSSVYDQFQTGLMLQVAFLIVATIFAPIFEELLFRRVLLTSLLKLDYHPAYAISVSAFIFGLAHSLGDITGGSLVIAGLHLVSTTTIGIALGVIYVKTKNVIYPMIFHALNNGSSSALSLLSFTAKTYPIISNLLVIVILLIFGLFLLYGLYKFVTTLKPTFGRIGRFIGNIHLFATGDKVRLFIYPLLLISIFPLFMVVLSVMIGVSSSYIMGLYWLVVVIWAVIS